MRLAALAAVVARLDVLFGVVPCPAGVVEEEGEEDADRNALCQLIFEGYVSARAPVVANNVAQQRCVTYRQFHTDGQIFLSFLLKSKS